MRCRPQPTTAPSWSAGESACARPPERGSAAHRRGDHRLLGAQPSDRAAGRRADRRDAGCFADDPDLKRGLSIVADDEVNHLSYCHEELIRLRDRGHADLIARTLKAYAHAEIRTNRDVSLAFAREMARILGWPAWKKALLLFGAHAVWAVERLWLWRRMVRLAPPQRPNALGAAFGLAVSPPTVDVPAPAPAAVERSLRASARALYG